MAPATDTVGATAEADPAEGPGGWRRRAIVALAGLAGLAVLYLGASLVAPERVPRPIVLPRPEPKTYVERCDGDGDGGGSRVSEHWQRDGPIWTRVRFSYGTSCPPG